MSNQTPLSMAIDALGLSALARECGVTHQAVRKWQRMGRMPRTEWTGETQYSSRIEAAMKGRVTQQMLLQPWQQTSAPCEAPSP